MPASRQAARSVPRAWAVSAMSGSSRFSSQRRMRRAASRPSDARQPEVQQDRTPRFARRPVHRLVAIVNHGRLQPHPFQQVLDDVLVHLLLCHEQHPAPQQRQ